MDQTSATTAPDTTAQAAEATPAPPPTPGPTIGFRERGRVRRRARYLRKARELAYRDLGGLVFNLHRFAQRNDTLVLAKLNTLGQIDNELRTLESALGEREPITVLREAGITACPRCAAIHSSEDRFCPNCGLPLSRHVDLPIASAAPAAAEASPAAATAPSAGSPDPSPAPVQVGAPAPDGGDVSGAGRAPTPPGSRAPSPAGAAAPAPAPASLGEDEPTEIVRPRPAGR